MCDELLYKKESSAAKLGFFNMAPNFCRHRPETLRRLFWSCRENFRFRAYGVTNVTAVFKAVKFTEMVLVGNASRFSPRTEILFVIICPYHRYRCNCIMLFLYIGLSTVLTSKPEFIDYSSHGIWMCRAVKFVEWLRCVASEAVTKVDRSTWIS